MREETPSWKRMLGFAEGLDLHCCTSFNVQMASGARDAGLSDNYARLCSLVTEVDGSIDVGRCFRSRRACNAGSMRIRKGQGTIGFVGVVVNGSDGGEQCQTGQLILHNLPEASTPTAGLVKTNDC